MRDNYPLAGKSLIGYHLGGGLRPVFRVSDDLHAVGLFAGGLDADCVVFIVRLNRVRAN